ncbi:hypothetical protein [Sideroxydans lithotrophicus]|uniref:Uncharacterized protein n=1 Tax=Sideroxydans lithotrophicus (strain ES-1) TaxID=580332 RepID=D5CUA5_SIDLE|nr:hypothetical protein [Sideroxydans lithotrophicus]ADE10440.1 hypothetical protein Slit_0198 [Sideroxydans lithotrophicus ES-1]
MLIDLKSAIRTALVGSSALNPVDTEVLVKGHHRSRVEATLMELYQAREIGCCKIIKGSHESIVWWISGVIAGQDCYYGKKNTPTAPKASKRAIPKMPKAKVRRMSGISAEVKDLVSAQPGLTTSEICEKLNKESAEYHRIRVAIASLFKLGHLRVEGVERHYRYYLEVQA